jgi:hypothetical protein
MGLLAHLRCELRNTLGLMPQQRSDVTDAKARATRWAATSLIHTAAVAASSLDPLYVFSQHSTACRGVLGGDLVTSLGYRTCPP